MESSAAFVHSCMILISILASPLSGRGEDRGPLRPSDTGEPERLAEEVRTLGWIVFGARTAKGDWDLFVSRPDGSASRNITRTEGFHEAYPQFSRDGRRILYRRLALEDAIDGNHYGTQGRPVLARSDGSETRVLGEEGALPWASWSADGRRFACLALEGISIVDAESLRVERTLARRGFFQQPVWSPDGLWFTGVANAYGTGWSIARMRVESGEASVVNRVDCCTPDWFADSQRIVFSWRPQGQASNQGYGWTQLWMADADAEDRGSKRRLIYAEEGRHVYGGHASPDGRYVLFTGNMKENGDSEHSGAPMGLVRLADTPIIVGACAELRALHPKAGSGPVLVLPEGWEPAWTASEEPGRGVGGYAGEGTLPGTPPGTSPGTPPGPPPGSLPGTSPGTSPRTAPGTPPGTPLGSPPGPPSGTSPGTSPTADDAERARLREELRTKGWIVYSAASERGDLDLFLSRPDGSSRRTLVSSAEFSEAGARFSRDGRRLLYYRVPKDLPVDNNSYGTFELVVAEADGGRPESLGSDLPWADWGPAGNRISSLAQDGIRIVDLGTRAVVRRIPRGGFVEQLAWSPDGKYFAGTANGLGPYWVVASTEAEGRAPALGTKLEPVSERDRYNCTPDWFPDSRHVIYSRGIVPERGGWAQLWSAARDGSERRPLYAENARHIYGGCVSPDGNYAIFTRSEADLGVVDLRRTTLSIIRLADSPVSAQPDSADAEAGSRRGPRLDLGLGWEPHWTSAEIPVPRVDGPAASRDEQGGDSR